MNDRQRVRQANILTDIGQIIFAASVIAPFFQGVQVTPLAIVFGLLLTFVSFTIALHLEKGD